MRTSQLKSLQLQCQILDRSTVVADDQVVVLRVLQRQGGHIRNRIGQKIAADPFVIVTHPERRLFITLL